MDEKIFSAIFGGNESIPLFVIEPFYGSFFLGHKCPPLYDACIFRKREVGAKCPEVIRERLCSPEIKQCLRAPNVDAGVAYRRSPKRMQTLFLVDSSRKEGTLRPMQKWILVFALSFFPMMAFAAALQTPKMAKCGDDLYNSKTQGCCGGDVYEMAAQGCCGGQKIYTQGSQKCCSGGVVCQGNQRCLPPGEWSSGSQCEDDPNLN